jgi:CheY-like chemotaxis protein
MKKLKEILLIDDDEVTNFLNETILKELNISEEVTVLNNGKEALEYLLPNGESAHCCPELVILDHNMPIMDGLELMKALNDIDFVNRSKVVFLLLAVDSREEHIEEFQRLGVQEFTRKPISKETVMDAYHKYWADDTARDHTQ